VETGGDSVTNDGRGAPATPPPIPLDRLSPVPLYFQLAQGMERAIASGALPAGARLENEIDLAVRLGVSRPTMRRAIQHLVDASLLERLRGIGTRVLDPAARPPTHLTGLWDDLAAAGRAPGTQVLDFAVEPAKRATAEALGIERGTPVYAFTRLRSAGAEPLALLHNVVPVGPVQLSRGALAEHGLYPLLRAAGIAPTSARRTIGARAAKGGEARRLGEVKGAALLTVSQTSYDARDTALALGEHVFRPSLYSVDVTTQA
jgi:DNA-binding GntR family transcriptional regulator